MNGTYACQNNYLLNQVLKNEYGFSGFVLSDWWATMSGVPSIQAGLDMTMPDPNRFSPALLNGKIVSLFYGEFFLFIYLCSCE